MRDNNDNDMYELDQQTDITMSHHILLQNLIGNHSKHLIYDA